MLYFILGFLLGELAAFGLFYCVLCKRDRRWKKIIMGMQIKHLKDLNQLKEYHRER